MSGKKRFIFFTTFKSVKQNPFSGIAGSYLANPKLARIILIDTNPVT